jgi:hypothetical protein
MKFIISTVLSFCILHSSIASTGTIDSIIDDYQYFISVEWDQKDLELRKARSQQFADEVKESFVRSGLTKEDFFKVLERRIPNKRALDRLKLSLSLIGGDLSVQEISELTEDFQKDLYSSGASWNPSEEVQITLFIVGTIIFTGLLIWWAKSYQAETSKSYCELYPNSNICDENGQLRDYVCTSYKDEWECNTTTSTNYYGEETSKTTCGWKQVCASGYWK